MLLFFPLGLENEGWFDPYLLTRSFQQKAESLGAQYCRGEVIGFECNQVDKGMGVPGYYQGQGKRIKSVKVGACKLIIAIFILKGPSFYTLKL